MNFKNVQGPKSKPSTTLASGVKVKIRNDVAVLGYEFKTDPNKNTHVDQIMHTLAKNLKQIHVNQKKYNKLLRLNMEGPRSETIREKFHQKQRMHSELLERIANMKKQKIEETQKKGRILGADNKSIWLETMGNTVKKKLDQEFKEFFQVSSKSRRVSLQKSDEG